MSRSIVEGELRYAQLPDGAMVLQQWIRYFNRWVVVPVVPVASLEDNKLEDPKAVPTPPPPAPVANDTVSTTTPTSNAVLLPALPSTPAEARDLDTLISVLIGGHPQQCHVTHVDQCTATVDLRDLMRIAGPEWRAKLAAIDATHAANQSARIAREAKEAANTAKPAAAAQ